MNSKVIFFFFALFITSTALSARMRIPVCFPCETIETTQDLSTDEELSDLIGTKVNLAYFNKEYGVLWTSFWNTEGRYVLSDNMNSTYWDIDDELAGYLKEKHQFDIETAENPLSFWTRFGGKIVLILIIGLIIYSKFGSKDSGGAVCSNILVLTNTYS